MALTGNHEAVEFIARSLLLGTALLGDDLRVDNESGVSSLLFGSEVNVHGPNVILNITSNTWFESEYIAEGEHRFFLTAIAQHAETGILSDYIGDACTRIFGVEIS